jgi:hypothetical protein
LAHRNPSEAPQVRISPQYLGKLLQRYLQERSFMVRVNQTLSLPRPIKTGTFNGIAATDKTTIAFSADDLCFCYSHGNLKVINNRLKVTLDKIKLWFSTRPIKLNIEKKNIFRFK